MAYRTLTFRQAQLDQLLKAPNGTVGQHMQSLGRKTTLEAQHIADQELKRGRGRYHRGFRSTVVRSAKGPRMRVENTARVEGYNLAAGIERGTRPHVIRPRRAKVLAFTVGGRRVFARLVNHPGTRAYRVLERALQRVIGRDR